MVKERQKLILKNIIQEYIKKAQPVSSQALSKVMKLSSATIRNEMVDLIKKGYLIQPHLSAGRKPTLKSWQYYLENLEKDKGVLVQKKALLKIKNKKGDKKIIIKKLIRKMADLTGELSFIAFNKNTFYYTGLTNLFNQPEFQKQEFVCDISQVIDCLDENLKKVFDSVGQETKILIGKKNPFKKECGVIFKHCSFGLIGILGPLRMNYKKNIFYLETICKIIKQI